jgi:hypothetical protein
MMLDLESGYRQTCYRRFTVRQEVETVVLMDEIDRLQREGAESPEVLTELSNRLREGYGVMPVRLPRMEFYWWIRLAKDSVDQAPLERSVVAQSMQFNSFP